MNNNEISCKMQQKERERVSDGTARRKKVDAEAQKVNCMRAKQDKTEFLFDVVLLLVTWCTMLRLIEPKIGFAALNGSQLSMFELRYV